MMEGETTWRIKFPLDLTCPACKATPVRFVVDLASPESVEVNVRCACGQSVNYGNLPATYEQRDR